MFGDVITFSHHWCKYNILYCWCFAHLKIPTAKVTKKTLKNIGQNIEKGENNFFLKKIFQKFCIFTKFYYLWALDFLMYSINVKIHTIL